MEYLRKPLGYDDSDKRRILEYALRLQGRSFYNVLEEFDKADEDTIDKYTNPRRKGGLGNLIEEVYFGYKANSDQEPDFPKVQMELKLTPYKQNKNKTFSAAERLVITMINFSQPIEEHFAASHAWTKIRSVLLIHYLRDLELKKAVNGILNYKITHINHYSPSRRDFQIMTEDYNIIKEKIKKGLARELSEADTMYLGACTKGKDSSSVVPQYYGEHTPAVKRAFCLKTSYMTALLRNHILGDEPLDSVFNECHYSEKLSNVLIEKINKYAGLHIDRLLSDFNIETKAKQKNSMIALRMLGVKTARAEELQKANIIIKTINLNKNGKMQENFMMSDVSFKNIEKQEWEESDTYKKLTEEQYLFVVFKDGYLMGAHLWHMPYKDLQIVKNEWLEIKEVVKNGIKLIETPSMVKNNLPGSAGHIYHIRPHSQKTYYKFEDGRVRGNGTQTANGVELPDGRFMTRQADWLKNDYIMAQLPEMLK